jgi:hypothetical protein
MVGCQVRVLLKGARGGEDQRNAFRISLVFFLPFFSGAKIIAERFL